MDSEKKTLQLVFTIFRHGARTPMKLTPNDANRDYWSEGPAQLTQEGKRQAYDLGLWYRQRYAGFISSKYSSDEVYVYSTDTDRTVLSAHCLLAALFPSQSPPQSLDTLTRQSVPVHTLPNDPYFLDWSYLDMDEFPAMEFHKPKHVQWYRNYLKNKDVWTRWMEFSGSKPPTLLEAITMTDTLLMEKKLNLAMELPKDITEEDLYPQFTKLFEGVCLCLETMPYFIKGATNLLTAILDAIMAKVQGTNNTKFYIFSMHDINIFSLLGQLDLVLPRVEFCGLITFELHKMEDNQYYVRDELVDVQMLQRHLLQKQLMQYLMSKETAAMDIPLLEQKTFCPLQQFQQMVQDTHQRAKKYHKNVSLNK